MKAFLLAAGLGTRLKPLTDHTPKCLVPIAGQPLLGIWFELCARHGIREVLVNLHHLPEQVRDYVAAWRGPLRITTVFEAELPGSAGTVSAQRAFVAGEQAFFILYADNLTDVDLSRMLAFHHTRHAEFTIALAPTDTPREKGILTLDAQGVVVDFTEKPALPRSNLANAGIYIAGPRLFALLDGPQPRPFDFGFHVLPRLVGRMHGYAVSEYLQDIGTPAALASAERDWPRRRSGL